MKIDGNTLIADEGKILIRRVGYPLKGKVVHLGKVNIDGKLVEDVASNWEEIDEPARKEFKFNFKKEA